MSDLLDLSARVIDEGRTDEPVNRVTNELSELADDLAMVESFSHVVAFRTGDGLVVFDTSGRRTGPAVTEALRRWSTEPLDTIVYTHGHVDHVGGSGPMVADGRGRGHRDPRVIGHVGVAQRFDRYRATNAWNVGINNRQFGGAWGARQMAGSMVAPRFLPDDVVAPTTSFTDRTSFRVGDLGVELRHARGETDDHAWAWIPARRAVCSGDFLTWVFPNAGNP